MSDASSMVTPGAVFLSYAHEDTPVALCIADALHHHGIEVWLDQAELGGGDAWDQEIRRQIHACALFMPIISRHTQERSEGYFRREWKMGIERTHDMAEDVAFIVPVVIDDTSDTAARVPEKFREVQWTRLSGGEVPDTFAARVRRLLGQGREPVVRAVAVSAQSTSGVTLSGFAPEPMTGWRPGKGDRVPGTAWTLEAKLGEGGFGEVWLGRHATMKEQRVFKFCFRADWVRSLKRELTLFRVIKERVGAHPNIVRLLDVHFNEPPVYVEMDYVAGESLKVWCEQQGGVDQVPLAVRLEIVAQIADALQAAHAAGVIHRDVKPGNVLIEQTGAGNGAAPLAKLSDFGIGQVMSGEILASVTQAGFTQSIVADYSLQSGTQLYMAPELLAGEAATAQSDIYSLGVVLFQLLVGDLRRPLTTDWRRAIDDPCLREDFERCFAGKIAERFAHAGLLAESLRALPQRRAVLVAQQAAAVARGKAARRWKFIRIAGVAALVVGLGAGLIWFLQRNAKLRWARETALPEINKLVADRDYIAACALATQVEKYLPTDPALTSVWPKIAAKLTFETTPPDAEIYYKEYRKPESAWQYLGRSPLKDVRLARVVYRWQIRKDGYVLCDVARDILKPIKIVLDRPGVLPPDMVRVEGGTARPAWTGLPAEVQLDDYFIDRFEVSNRQYHEFVARGGYANRSFWKVPFIQQGKELTWDDAIAEFRDTTGQPGPATWANGTYPDGAADLPVTGLSWFEAAAYAEFAGKRLPSVYHWRWATWVGASDSVVPLSNFAGRGLAPVGHYQGLSWDGAFDMAGNAREWCWNEAGPNSRYFFGGGWSEPEYTFALRNAGSPFSRDPLNGFRCMKLLSAAALDEHVDAPVVPHFRDYSKETPVSDEVFQIFLRQFSYDKTPLDARLEERIDDGSPDWRCEKVSFNAAYNNERMTAFLFLPKGFSPPYQAIVYFPGSGALEKVKSSADRMFARERFRFILEAGRAVVYPIYKGTFERGMAPWSWPGGSSEFREWAVQQSKDLARTIDYLETRPDIQSDKLAYVGFSWGAMWGALLPAVEHRLKVNVLLDGGFDNWRPLPDADPINFAPRITIPTLMVNGSADFRFPLETLQRPLFRMLGTPAENKRHVLYDTGHAIPPDLYAKEVIAWLDRYLGPVK